MAAIQSSPVAAPSFIESSLVIPTTKTAPASSSSTYDHIMTMCDNDAADPATAILPTDENDTIAARMTDESTHGALDALAALAAASTAVSASSSHHHGPHSEPSPQEITPHQTSDDDDSEIMPPPPPRGPAAVGVTEPYGVSVAAPTFAFHHYPHSTSATAFAGFNHAGGGVGGRLRSASNPEGMEKWDLYSRRNDRQHFVLPSSILEEELASTRRVLGEVVNDEEGGGCGEEYDAGGDCKATHGFVPPPPQRREPKSAAAAGFQHHWQTTSAGGVRRSKRTLARLGTSPDSVSSDLAEEDPPISMTPPNKPVKADAANNVSSRQPKKSPRAARSASAAIAASSSPEIISSQSPPPEEEDEEVDESTLEPEELLRRARSRLLEDLSEGGAGSGEKGGGVMILPHSLSKYKEVYNKNGRIGIYTPAERAAIIQKFNAKRARRVWNKKIRYNCRKNLADRRMRVKGRFVKRSVEAANSPPPLPEAERRSDAAEEEESAATGLRSGSPPTSGSPLTTVNEHEQHDEEMPDVEDEEAGFEPSEDMPYRRTRRYTIT